MTDFSEYERIAQDEGLKHAAYDAVYVSKKGQCYKTRGHLVTTGDDVELGELAYQGSMTFWVAPKRLTETWQDGDRLTVHGTRYEIRAAQARNRLDNQFQLLNV